jgi:ketopantoate hydroxymethyltransferase
VRRYAELATAMREAFGSYLRDVAEGAFPGDEHGYS